MRVCVLEGENLWRLAPTPTTKEAGQDTYYSFLPQLSVLALLLAWGFRDFQ